MWYSIITQSLIHKFLFFINHKTTKKYGWRITDNVIIILIWLSTCVCDVNATKFLGWGFNYKSIFAFIIKLLSAVCNCCYWIPSCFLSWFEFNLPKYKKSKLAIPIKSNYIVSSFWDRFTKKIDPTIFNDSADYWKQNL